MPGLGGPGRSSYIQAERPVRTPLLKVAIHGGGPLGLQSPRRTAILCAIFSTPFHAISNIIAQRVELRRRSTIIVQSDRRQERAFTTRFLDIGLVSANVPWRPVTDIVLLLHTS